MSNNKECVECGQESETLEDSRNGLTCYDCRSDFESSYDDFVDPLGLRR